MTGGTKNFIFSAYDYLITADDNIQVYNNNVIWHKEVPLKVNLFLRGCFSITAFLRQTI